MGDLINLNKARKARSKAAATAEAKANRVAHGVPKAEKTHAEAEKARLDALLDGAKRDDD
ncbi:MAG: DUF4169 family protein [Brevundimonas sp.]|nr:MAG: DUF4169 family protein [Brevundimonas sp.]